MKAWFDYAATLKILIFGLLAGAALPALFALGVRLRATGTGEVGRRGHTAPTLLSWAIFALVLVAALAGVVFIGRGFIADHLARP